MKKLLAIILLFCGNNWTFAFADEGQSDQEVLKQLAVSISEGVNSRDGEKVLHSFSRPSALIYGTVKGEAFGEFSEASNTAQGLADFVTDFDGKVEQFFDNVDVEIIAPGHALVTTAYRVLINGKGSHRGQEIYTAVMTKDGWKFISLMFTMERYHHKSGTAHD